MTTPSTPGSAPSPAASDLTRAGPWYSGTPPC